MNAAGQRIVVTAGESGGLLVAVLAAVAPGGSGCVDVAAMDAAVERLAASMTRRPTFRPLGGRHHPLPDPARQGRPDRGALRRRAANALGRGPERR